MIKLASYNMQQATCKGLDSVTSAIKVTICKEMGGAESYAGYHKTIGTQCRSFLTSDHK